MPKQDFFSGVGAIENLTGQVRVLDRWSMKGRQIISPSYLSGKTEKRVFPHDSAEVKK